MKKFKKLSVFLSSFLVLICLSAPLFADVGNVRAGSSSSSSTTRRRTTSISRRNSSSSGVYASGTWSTTELIIFFVITGGITAFKVTVKALNESGVNGGYSKGHREYYDESLVKQVVQESDPNFSPQAFKTYAQEVFIQVQEAWEDRDMNLVRPLESDSLYQRHQTQLEEYIEKGWYPHLDGQCIDRVVLADFQQEGQFEYLIVKLDAGIIDYTTNENGRVVDGDPHRLDNRSYCLTFKRALGLQTDPESILTTKACPNCGAPTNVGAAGTCEFCGSVVTTGEHNWVLDNYEAWY